MTKILATFELELERVADGPLPMQDRNRLPRLLAESLPGTQIFFQSEEWAVRKARVRASGQVTKTKVEITA